MLEYYLELTLSVVEAFRMTTIILMASTTNSDLNSSCKGSFWGTGYWRLKQGILELEARQYYVTGLC